jgi:hypothetical protein
MVRRTPEAAERLRAPSFLLDGEGVILKADGVSDFDRLHSRRHDREVQFLGFFSVHEIELTYQYCYAIASQRSSSDPQGDR